MSVRTIVSQPIAVTRARVPLLWRIGILLIVVIGCVVWLWMTRTPSDGSTEVTFARDMTAHHAQAVDMALIVHERSNDPELRQFALDITLTQQAQIGQMQGWLAVWGASLTGAQPPMRGQGETMGMASQAQVNTLHTLPPREMEIAFLQLMIRHHQGGVMMAQDALGHTSRPEVMRLATAIVQGQESEIAYMRTLLQQRGAPCASR